MERVFILDYSAIKDLLCFDEMPNLRFPTPNMKYTYTVLLTKEYRSGEHIGIHTSWVSLLGVISKSPRCHQILFFNGQHCQSNFRTHILKPFLQGKIHPGEAESDVFISAVVSNLAGVHATLEEFLQTVAANPSLEFRCLPRNIYRDHFISL